MSIVEKYNEFVAGKRVVNWQKGEVEVNRQLVIDLSPSRFKPKWNGKYLVANDGTFLQIISVGDPSPENPNRQGISTNTQLRLIDDVQRLDLGGNACLSVTQTSMALPSVDEMRALEEARRENMLAIAMQENADGNDFGVHDQINDFISKTIAEYNQAVYDGTLRMFKFSLLIAVRGKTTKDVDDAMALITQTIESKSATWELLKDGQVDAYQMMQLTPYIKQRLLCDNPGTIIANTCPARRTTQPFPDTGRWMWVDEKGEPVFIDHQNRICGHDLIVGGSGRGKSVEQLKNCKRVVEEGKKAIHLLPKPDKKTNAIRLCEHLKGSHVVFSPEDCPNIFMPFHSKTMDTSYSAYQTSFNKLAMRAAIEIGLLIGPTFTNPQKNHAYNTIIEACQTYGIIDEMSRVRKDFIPFWNDGERWPDFMDMKEIWRIQLTPTIDKKPNPKYIKEISTRQVVQALHNNTSFITPYGTYRGLISKKPLVMDEKFTLMDLTSLIDEPNIQNALIHLVISAIQSELQLVPDGMEQPETYVSIDEGATLMELEGMQNVFKKQFRELRAFDGHLSLSLTDLATTPRPMINLLKQNVDYILLACNAKGYNLRPLVKEFALNSSDIRWLRSQGRGKFLLLYGDTHLQVFSALTPDDEAAILPENPKLIDGKKQTVDNGYMVEPRLDPRVEWVWKNHHIFCKDWLVGITKKDLPKVRGCDFEQFDHPFIGGKKTIYIQDGLEKEDGNINLPTVKEHKKQEPHIENQSKAHYLFVYSLGGEVSMMEGVIEVTGDDYGRKQRADLLITAKQPSDHVIKIGIEVEMKGSHTADELQEKRDYLLGLDKTGKQVREPVCDYVIFTCDHDYYNTGLRDAVGSEHSAPRGQQLRRKILKCISEDAKPAGNVSSKKQPKQKTDEPPVSIPYFDEIIQEDSPIITAL